MNATVEKNWRIPNRIEAMSDAAKEVFDWMAEAPVSSRAKYSVGLVVEEMVGNVIKYAYEDDREHEILLSITIFPDHIRAVFEDDGRPFDPTTYPSPNVENLVNSNRVGGLGIELVRRVCTRMVYEREGGRNRNTLTIRRLEPDDTQPIALGV